MERNLFGIAVPLRQAMEQKIVADVSLCSLCTPSSPTVDCEAQGSMGLTVS